MIHENEIQQYMNESIWARKIPQTWASTTVVCQFLLSLFYM